jgi:tetratricopeptide (TPR) repeat protein
VRDIARQLNVGMVLEGSLRHEGGLLHITADLVNASGFMVWTRSYDCAPADLLGVEARIAETVVTSLKGSLPDADPVRLALGGTTRPDAFDAYLNGMVLMGPTNGEANQAATDAFTRAIALDPGYAEALVARARAQTYMACNGGVTVSRAGALLDAALADAQHAVAQAPGLGAAHAVLGLVLGCRLQDLGRAAAEYGQAVALAPYDAATVTSYALFQTDLGHMDLAVKEVTHATELDPLASVYDRMLAHILAYAGRFPEAFVALRHAASLPPADRNADRIFRGIVLTVQNDMAQAREVCAGEVDYLDLVCLALADHALGREAEAEHAFDRLRTLQGDSGAYNYAAIFAAWGRPQEALHWLQRAYDLRDPDMLDIKIDPRLASLRGTAAYQAIVQQMGFPP